MIFDYRLLNNNDLPPKQPSQEICKKLFDLVESMGVVYLGDYHILTVPVSNSTAFRVYNKDGICFDISKRALPVTSATNPTAFLYSFVSVWEGGQKLDENFAFRLMTIFNIDTNEQTQQQNRRPPRE